MISTSRAVCSLGRRSRGSIFGWHSGRTAAASHLVLSLTCPLQRMRLAALKPSALLQVQDMQAAVQFVRRMGKHVLCLLGHSKGGMNVVLYGARHGDVPKMVNLSGRFCPRDGLQQRVGSGYT